MSDFVSFLSNECGEQKQFMLKYARYAKLVEGSSQFIQRAGYYHLHNADERIAVLAASEPAPWWGTYRLDQFTVPKGSVLDITSIVFSMRADPSFPAGDTFPFFHEGTELVNLNEEMYKSFNNGITLDDHYLDPGTNRFLVRVNSQQPFSSGYIKQVSSVTFPNWAGSLDPNQAPPVSELTLSRYSGNPVMNRNILTQGDLAFHLIVQEEQLFEAFFQTEAGNHKNVGGEREAQPEVALPKAEAIVEWCGRLIPKTVFEKVMKVNG